MIWQFVLLIIFFLLIIPIPLKFKISFNILKLSGKVFFRVFKIFQFKIRVRFRGAYVYITTKKKTKREKLTSKNYSVVFIMEFLKQIYFRLVLTQLHFSSEVGYYNSAFTSALAGGGIDIISKCVFSRILNDKKSAHIFINNEVKYNQDCLNFNIDCQVKISLFDIIYSIINTLWSLKGEKYEKYSTTRIEQSGEYD